MRLLLVLALASCFAAGCGGTPAVKVEKPAPSAMLKASIEEIAASGQLGSGTEELQQQLETLKTTEPDKAAKLQEDYRALTKLSQPAAIKAKAKEMLGKL